MDPVLLIGIIIVLGFLGARLSDFVRIPWVVGYIIVGVILGSSGFNFLPSHLVNRLDERGEIESAKDVEAHLDRVEVKKIET